MYFNEFENKESIIDAFADYGEGWQKNPSALRDYLDNASILFASYSNESYEGDAMVIFEKNGTLYEVHGSHCSCNGLEGQWEPEETSLEALIFRYGTPDSVESLRRDHGDDAAAALIHLALNYAAEKILLGEKDDDK